MFGLTHILYMIISAAVSVLLFIVFAKSLKKKSHKELVLKVFAVLTVAIHFSSLWVDYFSEGSATVQAPMILPIYPCNICMWLLLICAFWRKREGLVYRLLTEFTFWGGTVCGSIGIILNENFGSNPTLLDYDVLKGMLSHSTMVFGVIYLLVGGFVKIRVFNVLSVISGLLLFIVDGVFINTLYSVFLDEKCNSMFLQEPAIPSLPWFNTFLMGLLGVILCFGLTALYERIFLPKEERWLGVLKNKYKNYKENKKVC